MYEVNVREEFIDYFKRSNQPEWQSLLCFPRPRWLLHLCFVVLFFPPASLRADSQSQESNKSSPKCPPVPTMDYCRSTKPDTLISMKCSSLPADKEGYAVLHSKAELTCLFTELSIVNSSKFENSPRNLYQGIDITRANVSDLLPLCQWLLPFEFRDAKSLPKQWSESPLIGVERKQIYNQALEACHSKDLTHLRRSILALLSMESQTCRLFAETYTVNFKYFGPNKWLSQTGSEGICERVYTDKLECDIEGWKYTRTMVDFGKKWGPFCASFSNELNKPFVASPSNQNWPLELNCTWLDSRR